MEFKQSYPLAVIQDITDLANKQEEFSLYVIPEQNTTCVGKEEYDEKYCADNNILVLTFGYNGGTIVTTPNDLNVVIALKKESQHMEILKKISELLNKLGVNSEIKENDIFLNGFKFCGIGDTQVGELYIYFLQISFFVNLPLIQAISKKEMIKIPKGIKEFYPNFKRDDLIAEIRKWLQ